MEQPRVERTLRLMRLMSGNAYLTVEQLAKRLDTSTRSIYRYIDTFKTCGFAVEKIDDSIYRLISMPSGYKDLQKLVYFSEEEARVLTYLIESLDETNSLKSSLYRKLCAVCDTKSIKEYSGTSKNAANVQALGNAMKDRKTVILKDYSSSSSGTVRDRVVEPFEFTNNHIDIWAYDCEKKVVSLFKIARIGWVDILPIDWQHGDEHDKGYLDAFRMQGKTQTHVRLEMTLRARNLLCEEFPLAIPDVKEKDGKFIFDSMVTHMEGVGRFVIGLAADIRVVDSPELTEYIRNYVKQNIIPVL
ncbi:MAG: helix-turn-helix transcriptional regulator [Candidatus Cryptobacteroides sp.]